MRVSGLTVGDLAVLADLDAVMGDDTFEFVGEHLHREHSWSGQDQDDADGVEDTLLAPVVGGQVGDLLRRPGALDRARGHREDRRADRIFLISSHV